MALRLVERKKAADGGGGVGGAEAVVDIDHGDSRAAGVEHAEQGSDAAETGAVSDAGRDGDDRLADEAGYGAWEGPFHTGGDDDGVASLEPIPYGEKAVDAGDADVADAIHGVPKGFKGDGGLLGDGDIRGAGAYHGHLAKDGGHGPADDRDAPRDGVKAGIGILGDDRFEVLRSGPGAEYDAIGLQKRAGDGENLLGEFSGAKDDLRETATHAAAGIDTGKT